MIELQKIDPSKNMRRFYQLSVEPTLFGDFALVHEWGRIGAKRWRTKDGWHSSALEAEAALAMALKHRLARGYS